MKNWKFVLMNGCDRVPDGVYAIGDMFDTDVYALTDTETLEDYYVPKQEILKYGQEY